MTVLRVVLLVLTCAGTAYYVLSALAIRAVLARARSLSKDAGYRPKVSLLKPVAGLDRSARANFESFVAQEYPDYDVLFGALDDDDPALSVIRQLIEGRANCRLLTGSRIDGANRKVRILENLASEATGDILIVTDADTHASPDFIERIVAPFADDGVGAVTCMYKDIDSLTTADVLEGLHMTCIFAPGVAAAACLGGIRFGLGAAIAVRRSALDAAGGFAALVDYLADDFQLGKRVADAGWRVEISDYVIDVALAGASLEEVLERETRWMRTTRVSNPRGHFGWGLSFGFAYSALYLLATGFSAAGWAVLGAVLAVRAASAFVGARLLGDRSIASRLPLLPLRDLLSFGIWIAGYFSNTVRWRGRELRVRRDGKAVPIE